MYGCDAKKSLNLPPGAGLGQPHRQLTVKAHVWGFLLEQVEWLGVDVEFPSLQQFITLHTLISDIQLPNKPLLQWKWSQTLHLTKMQILLKSSLQTPSGLNLIEHFKDASEKVWSTKILIYLTYVCCQWISKIQEVVDLLEKSTTMLNCNWHISCSLFLSSSFFFLLTFVATCRTFSQTVVFCTENSKICKVIIRDGYW